MSTTDGPSMNRAVAYLPGIFNETFDTVLYKPELRAQQLYRFACELIYCVIHEQEIRLTEPHGTDQFFIIRLLNEHISGRVPLDRVVDHFRIVPKKSAGNRILPLAESLALNLLNPRYDFSCLDDQLEQGIRRGLVEKFQGVAREQVIPSALQFLSEIEAYASPDDGLAIEYWSRVLREGLEYRTDSDENIIPKWNERRRLGHHKLPALLLGNYAPHPRAATLGQTVADACSEHRPELWRQCLEQLNHSKEEALRGVVDSRRREAIEADYKPQNYFNYRSKFYTSREQWAAVLRPQDFLFIKEMLDTTYNELTAHTTHSGHRVFMAGDPSSADQSEAQRAITAKLAQPTAGNHFSLAYLTDPVIWSWENLSTVLHSVDDALRNEEFCVARSEYNSAGDPEARRRALMRLQDPLNSAFEPAGVMMEINHDPSFTISVSVARGADHEVVLQGRDDPEFARTAHGEARHLQG